MLENEIIELMLLFIKSIAEHDWLTLRVKFTMLIVIYTCVLVAMIVDLVFGVRKAKERNELRSSEGLKRTIDKAIKYFGLLILFTLIDIIASITIGVPYFTMIGGVFIVGIEIKSWFEKANEKEKKGVASLISILRNKDNLAEAIADTLEETQSKDKQDEKHR